MSWRLKYRIAGREKLLSIGVYPDITLAEAHGVLDKMRKIRQACNQTFRYAIVTGRTENNPTNELAGALAVQKHQHYLTF